MPEIRNQDDLMGWIMNRLAEACGPQAILKGGMMLRLMDCQRHTNDLDYVFAPFKSKKEILPLITKALSQLDGVKLTHGLHSTSLRMIVEYQGIKAQVEANVADHCDSIDMSTSSLALVTGQLPRIIRVMKPEVAMAHKLAAWNERDLMRDLHDICFFTKLGVLPDIPTLNKRLAKLNLSRKNKIGKSVKSMSLSEFFKKLKDAANNLTAKTINQELTSILPPAELAGMEYKIRRAVQELSEKMLS